MAKKQTKGSRRKNKEPRVKVKLTGLQRVFYSLGITFFLLVILILTTIGILALLYGEQIIQGIKDIQNIFPDLSELGGG